MGDRPPVIDISAPGRQSSGRYRGARRIPISRLQEYLHEIAGENEVLIVGGTADDRQRALDILFEPGFHNAKPIGEGLLAYKGEIVR